MEGHVKRKTYESIQNNYSISEGKQLPRHQVIFTILNIEVYIEIGSESIDKRLTIIFILKYFHVTTLKQINELSLP